jgi:hypothetical protein
MLLASCHPGAVVGVGRSWNLPEADPEKRRQNLDRVNEGFALADKIGARCCVDIAGSFSTEGSYGPRPGPFSVGEGGYEMPWKIPDDGQLD